MRENLCFLINAEVSTLITVGFLGKKCRDDLLFSRMDRYAVYFSEGDLDQLKLLFSKILDESWRELSEIQIKFAGLQSLKTLVKYREEEGAIIKHYKNVISSLVEEKIRK